MDDDRRSREVVAIRVTELELDGECSAAFDGSGLVEQRADAVFNSLSQVAAAAARDAVSAVLASNGMGTYRKRGRGEGRLAGCQRAGPKAGGSIRECHGTCWCWCKVPRCAHGRSKGHGLPEHGGIRGRT